MARDDLDATRVERADPLMGAVLDNRFRIEFRLAAGGFGAIYRATHVKSGHQVALKVLHAELATSDASITARFRREGAMLEMLRDPHTITAYELGEAPTGELYIVMELLHGESLYEQFRARGALSWQRVVAIARMVCSSLAEAHARGIVHRDLKPANIHLEARDGNPDFVKVLDFGIAKIVRDSGLDTAELTQAGQMIGTFDYMAPEQMIGGECTHATDIYTLGVVMYEMIAGRRPFAEAQTPTSMLAALLTSDPPALATVVTVPAALDAIVMRCLQREPQDRFPDVHELSAALTAVLAADPGPARRIAATPPPQPCDEVTVFDTRPKAESRGEPPRLRHDSSQQPHSPAFRRDGSPPHVVRREGSGPVATGQGPGEARPHPAIIRRSGSQSYSSSPPDARRDPSPPPIPPALHDPHGRPGTPPVVPFAPMAVPSGIPSAGQPFNRSSNQPFNQTIVQFPLPPTLAPYGQGSPYGQAGQPGSPPVYPYGQGVPQASPPAYPYTGQPPQYGSQPLGELAPWTPPPPGYTGPTRGSAMGDVQSFDMSGVHSRDVIVRRVVWAIAILLGLIFVLVVANRL